MNIDSILTEWCYRLPKGYPTRDKDYQVLYDVLIETADITPEYAHDIVNRAKGLIALTEQDNNVSLDDTENNANEFADAFEFEEYMLNRYAISQAQQIIGLRSMYNDIIDHPDAESILRLITSTSKLQLKPGTYPIRGIYNTLYDIIEHTIKIPNGDQSELWFAIAFRGQVSGAVASEGNIEADITVGTDTVSLKNYEKTTFDFGSLPIAGTKLLNDFLEMAKLLTGLDINKSKGREQINNVLEFLDNESTEAQVRKLIEMSENTDIILIRNVGNRLKEFYSLTDNLDKLISAFCHIVDQMLQEKLSTVNWWGMIVKGNRTLFLESSADVFDAARCKNDRLSDAIANFHQNKLFVLGSQLSTKVTKKPQD